MKDTTKNILTKDWEFCSIRLPKELKNKISKDAKNNMRTIGLHIAYILDKHVKENK